MSGRVSETYTSRSGYSSNISIIWWGNSRIIGGNGMVAGILGRAGRGGGCSLGGRRLNDFFLRSRRSSLKKPKYCPAGSKISLPAVNPNHSPSILNIGVLFWCVKNPLLTFGVSSVNPTPVFAISSKCFIASAYSVFNAFSSCDCMCCNLLF